MRGKDGQLHDTKSTQTLETRDCRNADAFPFFFFLLKTTTSVLYERQKKVTFHLLFETLIFNLLDFFYLPLCKLLLQQIAY